jgi:hypothetical protein
MHGYSQRKEIASTVDTSEGAPGENLLRVETEISRTYEEGITFMACSVELK